MHTTLQHQVLALIPCTFQAILISSTQSLPLCPQCHLSIPFYSPYNSDTHISLYFNHLTPHTSSTLNTQTTHHLILQPVCDRHCFLITYLFSSLYLFNTSISTFITHNDSLTNCHSLWLHVCLVSLTLVVSQDITKWHGTVT